VRGCGTHLIGATSLVGSEKMSWLAEVVLGWPAVDGDSPVRENPMSALMVFPSSSGPVESAVNLPGPPGKPEYLLMTDSGLVP
jgi:hypothetical protein